MTLTRASMVRSFWYRWASTTAAPRSGVLSNHRWSCSLELEKAQSAISINTVVGRPGSQTPSMPRPLHIIPTIAYINFFMKQDYFITNLMLMFLDAVVYHDNKYHGEQEGLV